MIQSINKNSKNPSRPTRASSAPSPGSHPRLGDARAGRAVSAEEKKKQEISRVIAKEMTAAQKALQAQQWQEAVKNLEAAETKSGLTAVRSEDHSLHAGVCECQAQQSQGRPGRVRESHGHRCSQLRGGRRK